MLLMLIKFSPGLQILGISNKGGGRDMESSLLLELLMPVHNNKYEHIGQKFSFELNYIVMICETEICQLS